MILNIYFVSTFFITSYYFYDLYTKEDSLYLFLLHSTKSSFYTYLFINFIIAIIIFIGLIIIYILFGEITTRQLKGMRSEFLWKIKRTCDLFNLQVINKLEIDLIKKYIAIHLLSFYIFFLAELLYHEGEILYLNYEKNKLKQFKIILMYVMLIYLNYIFYDFTFPDEKMTINLFDEILFFYIVNYEYFHCFIKLQEGFYKFMVNITSINTEKLWNKKTFVFDIFSIAKYLLYLSYDLKVNYLLIKMKTFNMSFVISQLESCLGLIIALKSFYSNFLHLKYIQSLENYDINKELIIQGEMNSKMGEKELNSIRKNEINICIICLCEIETGKYLNCGHIFHLNCIQEWILHCKKCPTCNTSINIYSNEKSEFFNKRLRIKTNNINNATTNNNGIETTDKLNKEEDLNQNQISSNSNHEF